MFELWVQRQSGNSEAFHNEDMKASSKKGLTFGQSFFHFDAKNIINVFNLFTTYGIMGAIPHS